MVFGRLLQGFFRVCLGVGLGFLWIDFALFSGWSSSFHLLSSQFPNNYTCGFYFPNTSFAGFRIQLRPAGCPTDGNGLCIWPERIFLQLLWSQVGPSAKNLEP